MKTPPRPNILPEKARLYPALAGFPPAVSDLEQAFAATHSLRLVAAPKSFHVLPRIEGLKRLWCFQIDRDRLAIICESNTLDHLYLDTVTTRDLSALYALSNLRVLSIETNTKAKTIDALGEMAWLVGLAVVHFKQVRAIEPIRGLKRLESLAVAGSTWTRMTIRSLEPLSGLRSLKYLDLTNLQAEDGSLEPLADLVQLHELECANFYPMEEFARLSGRLKHTRCTWFKPYVPLRLVTCKKCGADQMVMLTGKGSRTLCRACDEARISRHEEAFRRIVAGAA